MSKLRTHIVSFLLLLGFFASAQTQVEVITKTVRKAIPLAPGIGVSIQGQGARVVVKGSSSNEIELTLKLISKGLTKSVAEKELEYQKYVIDELNETIVIRNYLLLPKNVELTTIQETFIEVSVPNDSDLFISNSFGTISLNSFQGKSDITSEYGDVLVENFQGTFKIKENFGDLDVRKFNGSFTAALDHTELELIEATGSGNITSNLGSVSLINPGKMSAFIAVCKKTDIGISMNGVANYQWDIRSKYGRINVPKTLTESDTDPKENRMVTGKEKLPRFQLSTDFGNVTIEEK